MNILLIAIGTRGDVQPFITLGKALVRTGHYVSIAAAKGFASPIAEAGLTHHPLPMDFQELLQEPEMRDALVGLSGKLKAFRCSKDIMNEHLSAIWSIGLDVAPDLILHHFKGSLGPYIARRIGSISIPLMLQPGFMETDQYPQFLISSKSLGGWGNSLSHKLIGRTMQFGTSMLVNRWKKATNTDIGASMDVMQGYNPHGLAQRIHAYSPSIVPRPTDWPPTEIQTGYLFDAPADDFTPSPELSAFLADGPPPVYFGFGSMPGMDPEKITVALTGAIRRMGIRAVIATGWGALNQLNESDDVHVLKAAPHSWLFPRMAAVVHHGGSGTTHEGLRWGRPTLICPLFADQPFFGQRVADLKVGAAPIPQKNLSVDALTKSLEITLTDPVAHHAAQLGEQIRREDGVSEILKMVEDIT